MTQGRTRDSKGKWPVIDMTGQRYGRLVAIRSLGMGSNGRMWLFKCSCGKDHEAAGYHVRKGRVRSCGCWGAERARGRVQEKHNNWLGDAVTYRAAHSRVVRIKGPASSHTCEHCPSQARSWAYDHADPSEKVDQKGLRYSAQADHYIALCGKCHGAFDRTERARRREAA